MQDHHGGPLRTVWIIGAGFSYSLGGPLLPDLFRQEELDDLKVRYPAAEFGDVAEACWRTQGLFNWGKIRERQWVDAEQFVDFVDCTGQDSPSAAKLLRMSSYAATIDPVTGTTRVRSDMKFKSLSAIKSAVVRTLAAECSWFSAGVQVRTERWAPYRSWFSAVNAARHAVVSFNYDEVLELLSGEAGRLPSLPGEAESLGSDSLQMLELHGSVTWLSEGSSCRRVSVKEALSNLGADLALGIPGHTKRIMKDRLFEPLWRKAEAAIRAAEVIVFLGYRFPETDGDARRRILDAIKANSSRRLRIHVVLGPNIELPDAVRVRKLIEVCTRHNREPFSALPGSHAADNSGPTLEVNVEPLFAEDFLALYGEDGPLSRYAQ